MVVLERELVAVVAQLSVYRARTLHSVAIPSERRDPPPAYRDHVVGLRTLLRDSSFYYAHDWLVSHTQQRLATPEGDLDPNRDVGDARFVWNAHLLAPFLPRFAPWVVVGVDGFVASETLVVNQRELRYTLISRRGVARSGPRFLVRGADSVGNCANFVETEQILECGARLASWVTTRGSIPLSWTQIGAERIPTPTVVRTHFSDGAFATHVGDLERHYGPGVTLISLIDQSGKEAPLGVAYETAVRLFAPQSRFVSVDFHKQVSGSGGSQSANLSKLMRYLAADIASEFWFTRDRSPVDAARTTYQRSVSRLNCIDCLDRTNVVQALLGRYVLVRMPWWWWWGALCGLSHL